MAHPSRGNCREGRPVTARKQTLALSSNRSAEEAIVVATGAPRERGCPAWVVLGHFAGVEMVGVDPARVLLCPFAHTGKSCSLISELPAGRAEVLL
jgi:hypothetical protein